MSVTVSNIIKSFAQLNHKEQVALVQVLVAKIAQAPTDINPTIDFISEEPHYTYEASLPVLAKDWDQPEDDHWDNY